MVSLCTDVREITPESLSMAALALPISELEPVVIQARAETERVVSWSRSAVAGFAGACHIYVKAFALRQKFSHLVALQSSLLSGLVEKNFSDVPNGDLENIAAALDRIVEGERELLREAQSLGSEIRFMWNPLLEKLSEQAEHLDSISESLQMEVRPEGSVLLAVAAGQFAM
jgi:hypothetical protein